MLETMINIADGNGGIIESFIVMSVIAIFACCAYTIKENI
jgi:hypothetical protein